MKDVYHLTNTELDYWTGKACGKAVRLVDVGTSFEKCVAYAVSGAAWRYSPTLRPIDSVWLISNHCLSLQSFDGGLWEASVRNADGPVRATGPTPAIAMCRAVVIESFGPNVGDDAA